MVEKIGTVKNPLTIIAIFAGIAEVSGTVILPFISQENQGLYVWFLMLFPVFLVSIFFLTLNWNHRVLYSPSDYKNEDNFLLSLPRATEEERSRKIQDELQPDDHENTEKAQSAIPESSTDVRFSLVKRGSPTAFFKIYEDLLMRKLSREFGTEIHRDLKISVSNGFRIVDGIVREKGITTLIEAKYVKGKISEWQVGMALSGIREALSRMPAEHSDNARAMLAFVVDGDEPSYESIASVVDKYRAGFPYLIDMRIYRLAALKKEFDAGP